MIYALRGPELNYRSGTGGDFSYYYRFSDAKISVVSIPNYFCRVVRDRLLDEETIATTSYCDEIKGATQQDLRPTRHKKVPMVRIFSSEGSSEVFE